MCQEVRRFFILLYSLNCVCFHLQRHGNGTLKFPNGNEYVGDFKRNMIAGHGIMTYRNGDCYEGEWKHGLVRMGLGIKN